MKRTIKINFKDFWEGFNPKKNYFTDTLKENYNVVISNNPDYMFYSVHPIVGKRRDISSKGDFIRDISPKLYILTKKVYIKLFNKKIEVKAPKGDFVKILYATDGIIPNMNECDWAFSSHFEEKINHPNYFRIPMDLIFNYPLHKETRLPYKRKINFEKIKKQKTKFCNFIYSQDINKRNDFFKKLSKYKYIDAPGRCMNNMIQISNETPRASRVSSDWVKTKLNFIKPYKFTIAFENVIQDGWTTEKLTHPLLVNSIPIYIGNKKVSRDFNTKSFINYHDFKSMAEFINHIIEVDTDDKLYKQYLEKPIFNTKEQHYFAIHKRVADKLKEIIGLKKELKDKIVAVIGGEEMKGMGDSFGINKYVKSWMEKGG
jgi:hypothetical protein